MMRVGYAKLGRSVLLDSGKWGAVGGDNEPPTLLRRLAERNPDITFVIIGRNTYENPQDVGFPSNVENPWSEWRHDLKMIGAEPDTVEHRLEYIRRADAIMGDTVDGLDGFVLWVGQHGTSNLPIPSVENPGTLTKPQLSMVNYGGILTNAINRWRDPTDGAREEVWLNADTRNYMKARELKWPLRHPVLAQFDETKNAKHERYDDVRTPQELGFERVVKKVTNSIWEVRFRHVASTLEIVGIPDDVVFSDQWEGRGSFGIIINEARAYVKKNRLTAMQKYVMPLEPDFIHGKWSDASLKELGRDIQPVHHSQMWDLLRSVRSTLTTPSSGSGWATTKPWEAFACGTVCFFHPDYDTQGHIIPVTPRTDDPDWLRTLTQWLRVGSYDRFHKLVRHLNSDAGRQDWEWLVRTQRSVYDAAVAEQRAVKLIEERLRG